VIPADQVQAHVDSGRRARPGDYVPLVKVKGFRLHPHSWIPGGELIGVLPMRGDVQVVEQPGRGKVKDAQAVGS
jgi:hypothetical protein